MVEYRSKRLRRHTWHGILQRIFFPKTYGTVTPVMLWSRITTYAFFGLIGLVVLTVILFIWYGKDLPTPGKLVNNDLSQSTRIYDRKGILLYSVYKSENRVYVDLKDIPKTLQEATIAIEDRNFYTNGGFSITGYIRALRDIILLKRISGGSTLTQQLVRNVLLESFEQTVPRKIKELILAIQVDKKYSKDQILEMYLNDVSYGGTNTGVESASESYFGKHVQELDLAQAALIAGLPQGPSLYYPFNGNTLYLGRSKQVLQAMVDSNDITQAKADEAYKEIKGFQFTQEKDTSIKAPWFVMYVKSLIAQKFGEPAVENGGLQITTTLDYEIEKKAEDIVHSEIDSLKNYHVGNGAAVVMDPKNGQILAMVGNKDYFDTYSDGNFNDALALRQPGSSLKPVIYATAFEKGYTPATVLMDVKTDFPTGDPTAPTFTPVNYDGKFHGPVQVRFALGNSLNIPAVKMLAKVGIKDAMQTGYQMGIETWNPTPDTLSKVGLSLVLGGRETTLLQETTAYSTFATGGIRHDPVALLKITDSKNNLLYENHDQSGTQVMPASIAFLISHILLDNNARSAEFGPNSWLVIPGKTVSVKTGTTDEKRDNWTIGYTPSVVVGVWVGNNDNTPMNQAISSGITGASPIWNKIMTFVLKGKTDEAPQVPSDVSAVTIDSLFGGLPYESMPTRSEYFLKGTEPTSVSPWYKKKDDKTYYVIHEDDPVSTDGQNRWQTGIDAWIKDTHSAGDAQWYPPDDLKNPSSPTNTPTPTP